MGIFVSKRRVKNRRFAYEPRFYDPKKDDDIKRRMRVRSRARRRRNPVGNIFFFASMLFFALYIYYKMNGVDLFDYIF